MAQQQGQASGGLFGGLGGGQTQASDPNKQGLFGGLGGGMPMQNQMNPQAQQNMMGGVPQQGMAQSAPNQQMNVSYPYGAPQGNMNEPYCVYYIPWSAKSKFETQTNPNNQEEKSGILDNGNNSNRLGNTIDEVKLLEKAFANLHYDSQLRHKAEDF